MKTSTPYPLKFLSSILFNQLHQRFFGSVACFIQTRLNLSCTVLPLKVFFKTFLNSFLTQKNCLYFDAVTLPQKPMSSSESLNVNRLKASIPPLGSYCRANLLWNSISLLYYSKCRNFNGQLMILSHSRSQTTDPVLVQELYV